MAQWLERGALPMSLPAVRIRIPLGAELGKALHPQMLHLTQVKMSTW